MDWAAIKREYMTSNLSLRALAKKYNTGYTQMSHHSSAEGWVEARRQTRAKTESKAIEKTAEKASDVTTKIYTRAEEVLDKLGELTKNIVELSDAKLAADTLRSLKSALDVKSEADIREQEARIEKLRREAAAENEGSKEITVRFADPEAEEWQR